VQGHFEYEEDKMRFRFVVILSWLTICASTLSGQSGAFTFQGKLGVRAQPRWPLMICSFVSLIQGPGQDRSGR
jgi:hypothetical protein